MLSAHSHSFQNSLSYTQNDALSHFIIESIQHIVDLINNRPRKRLGFRTPLEVLYKFFVDFVALDLTIYLLIWYNAFNSRLNMSARQIGIYMKLYSDNWRK